MIVDCCHSGTAADLPYKFAADDTDFQIEKSFNMDTVEEIEAKEAEEIGAPEPEQSKNRDDDHAEPLPYDPEHGFIVRPARNPPPNKQPGKKKAPQDLPPPPPQCCTIL